MKVAVTGAAGFIGSHVLPALRERGHGVIAVDTAAGGCPWPDVPFRSADVASGIGLDACFEGADAVIHLAARNHVLRETAKDPLAEYRRVNVEGTRNAVRAAARAGARMFIHFSTVKAMGEGSAAVLDETSPCRPSSPYGVSKRESEEAAREEAAEGKMRLVVLRLPMVYGPGNKGNLPRMIRWAEKGRPFPLFLPDNARSVLYAGNVAAAVARVLDGDFQGAGTYILKDREDVSTRALYERICRELGITPLFLPVPAWAMRLLGRLSEDVVRLSESFRVSDARFEREAGFRMPRTLDEGIAETVAWHRRCCR